MLRGYHIGFLLAIALWLALFAVVYVSFADESDLATIRYCETRWPENPNAYWEVSPNGTYFGAYQFDLPTWYSVGGVGLPSEATPEEQDYRAAILYSLRGRLPWRNCFA